jgi:hypothetical protein
VWLRVAQTDGHIHGVRVCGHRAHDVPPSPTACFGKCLDGGRSGSNDVPMALNRGSGAHHAANLLCSALFIVRQSEYSRVSRVGS